MKAKNVKIGVEVVVKKSADLESIGLADSFIGLKGVIVQIATDEFVGVDFGDAWYYMRLDMLKLANKEDNQ